MSVSQILLRRYLKILISRCVKKISSSERTISVYVKKKKKKNTRSSSQRSIFHSQSVVGASRSLKERKKRKEEKNERERE